MDLGHDNQELDKAPPTCPEKNNHECVKSQFGIGFLL
jgi:hypothetical protein